MSVSKRDKEECAIGALNILVNRLVNRYGHNATFWLKIIYTSNFIINLMNVKTGYWGGGVAYHEGVLLKEMRCKGIDF